MALELRDYQQECVESIETGWKAGHQNVGIIAATGAGKTHVMAALAERWVKDAPPEARRVLLIAHRDELLRQAADRIARTGTGLRTGLVQANANQVRADVVIGSVQTLRRPERRRPIRNVGLVLVDECHHATAKSYIDVLEHFGALPSVRGLARGAGVTATMLRSDKGQLGDVWPYIGKTVTFPYLVQRGYLVPPVPYRIRVSDLDLSKVKMTRGDYSGGDLGAALHDSLAPEAVVAAYQQYAPGRQALLFTPTVALAEEMTERFRRAGFSAATVSGATRPEVRRATIRRAMQGKIDILCNCGVFTEGTDIPSIGCIILMRPTKSKSLFIQMVGRGARLDESNPKKTDFIVLDVCGASQGMSLSFDIQLFGEPVELQAKDDETLEEVPPEETERRKREADRRDGDLHAERFDLLEQEKVSWRQTRQGAWFLPMPNGRWLCVVPSVRGAVWDVVDIGPRQGDSRNLAVSLPLTDAMRIGELLLDRRDLNRNKEGAVWRARAASHRLIMEARAFGVTTLNRSAGAIADDLNVAKAERRIDPCLRRRLTSRSMR